MSLQGHSAGTPFSQANGPVGPGCGTGVDGAERRSMFDKIRGLGNANRGIAGAHEAPEARASYILSTGAIVGTMKAWWLVIAGIKVSCSLPQTPWQSRTGTVRAGWDADLHPRWR